MKKLMTMLLLLPCLISWQSPQNEEITLLIGTYTGKGSKGIYTCRFNQQSGDFSEPQLLIEAASPSFLTLSEDEKYLYAVSEEWRTPMLNAYRYDSNMRTAKLINSQPTHGDSPCHVALHQGYAYTANYTGGSLTAFKLQSDGSLGEPQLKQFSTPEVQSHIHGIFEAADGKSIYVTDLGRDAVYEIEAPLTLRHTTHIEKGSGPRHMVVAKKMAYLINEYSGKVTQLKESRGGLEVVGSFASDSVGGRGSADIHLSPDGRFLYASNRLKADGVSTFEVKKDGSLQKIAYTDTGIHPRNFNLTPNGRYLLVAERDSDQIEIFERDAKSGKLRPTGKSIALSMPVCLIWGK